MACEPTILRDVPLFALLDDDEMKVLAAQVELRTFAARQRIYKIGDQSGRAYVLISGLVQVTTIDEDHQDVVFDEPASGDFFGFASLLDQTPHPGMDMLTVLGQHLHAAQQLVRGRAARNPNQMIEEKATVGEHIADSVAAFGGSWTFILTFLFALVVYASVNVYLAGGAWDPYPFILLNLMLSMLAAIQAPVIMMSQNRQDTKDRLRGELDYDVNRRAAAEIQGLARKLNLLIDKVGDLDDSIRANTIGERL